ncbi:helix-turn-helix transcriptional regulator [Streptomyces sp. TS71-3]|uniref:ArsR/SmtB family transcription factor n=1 Tax=Streptomyces sp. TS71-3 TaxID=2733862 RepID=UPI001B069A35|nr:metalloregulator ArsR/SmtB family transcription factor [Streptomyces sp. TS71-3]GHJ35174.1 putative ArsR-family transcriptional regulator [Streptomyces sp. TS71-3]
MTTPPTAATSAGEPIPNLQAASDLLKALASPVRLGIVRELSEGEKYVHELVDALGVSQPLVSQHLRVLRNSRIVTARREAREIQYGLTDEHIAHIVLDAIRHARE